MFKDLFNFFTLLDRRLKIKLYKIQFLIVISSVLETLSVLSIGPFLSFISSPDLISSNSFSVYISELFSLEHENGFLIFLGSMILVLMIFSSFIAMTTIWKLSILGGEIGADLSNTMYQYYINQPLTYHLKRNTSELTSKLIVESNRMTHSIVMQFLHLNAKAVLILMMILTILATVPIVAILATIIFASCYVLMFRIASSRLNRNGLAISNESQSRMRTINESFGGIKDVLIHGIQSIFINNYQKATNNYYASWSSTQVLSLLPRYAMELAAYGTIISAVLFLLVTYDNDLSRVLPVIAVFGIASMKLLPAFQQCYFSISTIRANISSFLVVKEELTYIHNANKNPDKEKTVKQQNITFKEFVEMTDISFLYESSRKKVIKNLSIRFNANESTAIVGSSGSGKSTAINLLAGLLLPSSGKIFIDGEELSESNIRSWQSKIGFVSQNIFLTDASIKENIAFGLPLNDIDEARVNRVLKMAQLDDFVASLPEGLSTGVGERGVQLSGGQMQRIGIARALYRNPEILVFDEATSNLDRISEKAIMKTISNLAKSKTIIMIAHRLSTVQNCDNIFLMQNGEVEDSGTYEKLIKTNPTFIDMT